MTSAAQSSVSEASGISSRGHWLGADSGVQSLSPHLIGRLVVLQPDIKRVPQQVVGRPGRIGDFSLSTSSLITNK
jgi:hypothetical protein